MAIMAVQLVCTGTYVFYGHSIAFSLESYTSGQVSTMKYKAVYTTLYSYVLKKSARQYMNERYGVLRYVLGCTMSGNRGKACS